MGGLTAVRSGMPGSNFNVVFGLGPPTSLKNLSEGIDRLFVKTGTQFMVITAKDTLDFMRPLLDEKNLTVRTDMPGMVLDPIPAACPAAPSDLEIKPVTEPHEIDRYLSTGAAGFGLPTDYFDLWASGLLAESVLPSPPWAGYLGYSGGEPVATSLRVTTGRIAGIYFVSTLPDFRSRGFGTAMTWRAAVDGTKEGCRMSYLQSSPMGRPVYERMGYRLIDEYQEWKAETKESG